MRKIRMGFLVTGLAILAGCGDGTREGKTSNPDTAGAVGTGLDTTMSSGAIDNTSVPPGTGTMDTMGAGSGDTNYRY